MKISTTNMFQVAILVGITMLISACVIEPRLETSGGAYSGDDNSQSIPASGKQNIHEYGEMCAAAITEIPAFNCLDGEIVEITINGGETPTEYTKNMLCDRPAFLPYEKWSDGQCTPYTRVLNLSEGTAQISVMCRRKVIRDIDSPLFDEVDIIAHNTVDGSTCWFEALGDKGNGIHAERVPPPNEKQLPPDVPPGSLPANEFWSKPIAVAEKDCGSCHDNDPYMYSPYVAEVWNKLPTDPQGWYKHIGPDFASWEQPMSLSTRQNSCTGCHRLGTTFTSGQGTMESTGMVKIPDADDWAKGYPASHWMPPSNFHTEEQWDVIYQKAVQDILACHSDPTLPFCIIEPITGLPTSTPD